MRGLDRLRCSTTTARCRTSRCRWATRRCRAPVTSSPCRCWTSSSRDRFEPACTAAGARFIGGVFACARDRARRPHRRRPTYHVITPTTTRRTPAEFRPPAGSPGWCRSRCRSTPTPSATPRVRRRSPSTPAWSWRTSRSSGCSNSADETLRPAHPGPRRADGVLPRRRPAAAVGGDHRRVGAAERHGSTAMPGRPTRSACGSTAVEQETTVTVAFPNNPIARESVMRYLEAMKAVYLGVVDGARCRRRRHRRRHGRPGPEDGLIADLGNGG